jgi:hypothetical protein
MKSFEAGDGSVAASARKAVGAAGRSARTDLRESFIDLPYRVWWSSRQSYGEGGMVTRDVFRWRRERQAF